MARQSLDALLAIGELLAPTAKQLPARVRFAFEDPEQYIEANADRMDDRSIDAPIPNLPWIALVDELEVAKALWGIDWKASAEDIVWAIGKLRGAPKLAKWLAREPALAERSTWEVLEAAGIALRERAVQLASLDIGADDYNLVVVPVERTAELVKLAKAGGYGRADVFGDRLAAATKERERREQRDRAAAAKRRSRPQPAWITYERGAEVRAIKKAVTAFCCSHHSPAIKRFESHYYKGAKATTAGFAAMTAAWRADGFRKLGKRAATARLAATTDLARDFVDEIPETARYFREGKSIVRCVELRGLAVWSAGGMLGESFGEVTDFEHRTTPAQAQQLFDERVHGWSHLPALTVAAVRKRYKRKR